MLLILFLIYWFVAGLLFIVGVVIIIVSAVNNKSVKTGMKFIIASVIVLVIGIVGSVITFSYVPFFKLQ